MNRGELRDRLRQNIGDVVTTATDNFTDAQLNNWLYIAICEIQGDIEEIDQQYFETTATGSVTATQLTITLPTGFRKLIDYRRNDNNNNIQFNIVDKRNVVTSDIFPTYANRYDAYLTPTQLVYTAALNEAHTYLMTYTLQLNDVALDADSWNIPIEGQLCALYKATIMALGSENSKTDFWERQYAESKSRLVKALSRRSKVQPRRVQIRGDY